MNRSESLKEKNSIEAVAKAIARRAGKDMPEEVMVLNPTSPPVLEQFKIKYDTEVPGDITVQRVMHYELPKDFEVSNDSDKLSGGIEFPIRYPAPFPYPLPPPPIASLGVPVPPPFYGYPFTVQFPDVVDNAVFYKLSGEKSETVTITGTGNVDKHSLITHLKSKLKSIPNSWWNIDSITENTDDSKKIDIAIKWYTGVKRIHGILPPAAPFLPVPPPHIYSPAPMSKRERRRERRMRKKMTPIPVVPSFLVNVDDVRSQVVAAAEEWGSKS